MRPLRAVDGERATRSRWRDGDWMKGGKQTTLREDAAIFGIGVHSGLSATLTLHPADADAGIVFVRAATDTSPEREVRADFRAVTATEFATVLGDDNGTLEYMAAGQGGVGGTVHGNLGSKAGCREMFNCYLISSYITPFDGG